MMKDDEMGCIACFRTLPSGTTPFDPFDGVVNPAEICTTCGQEWPE